MYSRRVAIRKKREDARIRWKFSATIAIRNCVRMYKVSPVTSIQLQNSRHRPNFPFSIWFASPAISAPTFEKLKRRVRFIDRDRSLPSYPTLGHATPKKGSFDSSREKRERGDGRFEDLCARQRRAFQRPFSGRPSAARSVSSRRCDEHVNYYRQGSLAELQWR